MEWSYGLTTIPARYETYLPKTLKNLASGGFDSPHIFIDGDRAPPSFLSQYECTCHSRKIRTFGNWMTAAWELYVQKPEADYYAIFQDDLSMYKNLKCYLEECEYPKEGYWNLYTFPRNDHGKGWHLSNQRGLGAVALVFNNLALFKLLSIDHLVKRVKDPKRGHQAVDGGVVESFKKIRWREWVHTPSLVQHIGEKTSMGNKRHPKASTYKGDDFDACDLLKSSSI